MLVSAVAPKESDRNRHPRSNCQHLPLVGLWGKTTTPHRDLPVDGDDPLVDVVLVLLADADDQLALEGSAFLLQRLDLVSGVHIFFWIYVHKGDEWFEGIILLSRYLLSFTDPNNR